MKNQKDKVLNDNVTIFVDDAKIEGTSYTFDKAKEYTVHAEYKSIKSSKITIKAIASNITIEVKGGKTEIEKGETLEFVVKDEEQNELKGKVSIFVDDKKIDGFSYKFEEAKGYSVYAEYEGVKSPKITINVVVKMGMMDFFGVKGFPTLKLNRNTYVNDIMKQTEEALSKEANLGLAISSSLSDKDLTVKVKVHYTSKADGKNKLVVYLLENGLVAPQANYYDNDPDSPLYKKGNPIEDFEHNHVARKALTDVFGDEIPADKTVTDATYEKEFNITLPSKIKDSSKLDIVAFVVGPTFKAINAQKAKVGEEQPLD